jgi:hypothetical protein
MLSIQNQNSVSYSCRNAGSQSPCALTIASLTRTFRGTDSPGTNLITYEPACAKLCTPPSPVGIKAGLEVISECCCILQLCLLLCAGWVTETLFDMFVSLWSTIKCPNHLFSLHPGWSLLLSSMPTCGCASILCCVAYAVPHFKPYQQVTSASRHPSSSPRRHPCCRPS